MSDKKQTAVGWLVQQILKEKGLVDLDIQQALEMEKQQIIDAYKQGDIQLVSSEQYYNETFKP